MRTATVRDLRNRYSSLLEWIAAGEEIRITRRGKTVARLIPDCEDAPGEIDWSESPVMNRKLLDNPELTGEESLNLVREAGGRW